MRLIDADALLNELGDIWNIPKDWDGDIDETCETAFDVIENAPTVEANPVEWIPCSERVPEDETLLYWTTHEDGSLVMHGYSKRNGFIYNWEVDDLEKRKRQGQVIAWTPVFEPQPYNADMRGGKNE